VTPSHEDTGGPEDTGTDEGAGAPEDITDPDGADRRAFVAVVGAAVGAVTLTTVGQSLWVVGAVGAAGVVLMAVGVALLPGAPVGLLGWPAAVVIHDGLLVPLVLAVGALLLRLPAGLRRPARAALVVAACVTAVALPVLLRPGRPANPTVLPQHCVRNWLLVLASVVAVAATAAAAGALGGARHGLRSWRRRTGGGADRRGRAGRPG
jgi:hypothetical protein